MREAEENAHEFISPLTLTCPECLARVRDDAVLCLNCLSPDLSTASPRELELLWEDPAPTWEGLTVSIFVWVRVSFLVSVARRVGSDFEVGVAQ